MKGFLKGAQEATSCAQVKSIVASPVVTFPSGMSDSISDRYIYNKDFLEVSSESVSFYKSSISSMTSHLKNEDRIDASMERNDKQSFCFTAAFIENKSEAIRKLHLLARQSFDMKETDSEEDIYCQISSARWNEFVDYVVSETLIDLDGIA